MNNRRLPWLAGLAALALSLGPGLAVAQTADQPDGGGIGSEALAGYVGMASGAAFSLRPVAPALLPTGDAPLEATIGLSSANVKSGGNAYGQAAFVWPGSALANLGPLLGTGAGQPIFTQVVPPWPAEVKASQDDGEVVKGAEPGPVLRAVGQAGSSTARSQAGGGGVPGVLTFESIASTSRALLDGAKLVTESEVVLKGVKLLDGTVVIDTVRSISRATSDGTTADSTGGVDVVGLQVGGVKATLTKDGVKAGDSTLPGKDATAAIRTMLRSSGIQLELTDGTGAAEGGTADRVSTGVLVTMANPAAAASPQLTGSRIELTLAPTAVGAMASPPFTDELGAVTDVDLAEPVTAGAGGTGGTGGGFGAVADTIDTTFATGGGAAPTMSGRGGARGNGQALSLQPARRSFDGGGGVPPGLVVAVLAGTVFGGRWIRRFIDRIVRSEG